MSTPAGIGLGDSRPLAAPMFKLLLGPGHGRQQFLLTLGSMASS